MNTTKDFLEKTSLIAYNQEIYRRIKFDDITQIDLHDEEGKVLWLNTYGLDFDEEVKRVAAQNTIDDFIVRMTLDEQHRNKMIEWNDSMFLSLKVLNFENGKFESEQMLFIATDNYIWSLQEYEGDYFEKIRERAGNSEGIVRKKRTDYLLFLIVEAIIDNYAEAYAFFDENFKYTHEVSHIKLTPEFVASIEQNKQELFKLKKAIGSLKETIVKIENAALFEQGAHYFTELKEQASSMIDDIDFNLQQLESNLNLVFNMQSDRLNQVMKTLTVFSVIFIPLTFIAGIYGMNFKNIPELENPYGYFILLGVMLVIAIALLWYFKKKKWF